MVDITASKIFNELFKEHNLKNTYYSKIAHKASPGIDRVNRVIFEKKINENIKQISKKVVQGNYKYIAYKEKLISKGKGKLPRVISIPTIRDKITLNMLNEILTKSFSSKITTRLTQNIIDDLKKAIDSGQYNYFIKIDIAAFYDNIVQDILIEKIKKRVRKKEIIELIRNAIKNPTIIAGAARMEIEKGVPQGISISNILANIYLTDADKKFSQRKNIMYFRYVDDILILCNEKDKNRLIKLLQKELTGKLKLEVNEKEDKGLITKGFDFLGYKYTLINKMDDKYGFSVKEINLLKLESSIVKIFADYKNNSNGQVFLWKLNLRITGVILEKRKYGWLFFYSQIDDISILYHLDWFIDKKLCDIYNIKPSLKKNIKKFVFAYFEITKKRGKSSYIPRTDDFSISEQKRILVDVFEYNSEILKSLSDEQIRIAFKNKMYISVKDLERDVQSIS